MGNKNPSNHKLSRVQLTCDTDIIEYNKQITYCTYVLYVSDYEGKGTGRSLSRRGHLLVHFGHFTEATSRKTPEKGLLLLLIFGAVFWFPPSGRGAVKGFARPLSCPPLRKAHFRRLDLNAMNGAAPLCCGVGWKGNI